MLTSYLSERIERNEKHEEEGEESEEKEKKKYKKTRKRMRKREKETKHITVIAHNILTAVGWVVSFKGNDNQFISLLFFLSTYISNWVQFNWCRKRENTNITQSIQWRPSLLPFALLFSLLREEGQERRRLQVQQTRTPTHQKTPETE